MRLSFSTRGWQHLSWDELLEAAVDADLEGVEVYDLFKRPDLIQRGGPFDKYNAVTTARTLRDRGLRIPCLDTSCDLSDADSADIILGLIETARAMQIPCISAPVYRDDEERICSTIRTLLPAAAAAGVTILIRTTGVYSDTGRLRLSGSLEVLVNGQSVSRWETGQTYPDITLVPKIAAYFGVTTDELLVTDEETREREINALYSTCRDAV